MLTAQHCSFQDVYAFKPDNEYFESREVDFVDCVFDLNSRVNMEEVKLVSITDGRILDGSYIKCLTPERFVLSHSVFDTPSVSDQWEQDRNDCPSDDDCFNVILDYAPALEQTRIVNSAGEVSGSVESNSNNYTLNILNNTGLSLFIVPPNENRVRIKVRIKHWCLGVE